MFRPRLRPASLRAVFTPPALAPLPSCPPPAFSAFPAAGARTVASGASVVPSEPQPMGGLHSLKKLNNQEEFEQKGIPGFMTAGGFQVAYNQYQQLMIDKVNQWVAQTPDEGKTMQQLAVVHSRDPLRAPLFNAASMAHNNAFFFSGIASCPHDPETLQIKSTIEIPPPLKKAICDTFGSVDTFRRTFLTTAEAMFGPGFVWLVKLSNQQLRIVNTYLAGSPYAAAHYKRQGLDTNTAGANDDPNATEYISRSGQAAKTGARAGTTTQEETSLGGVYLTPLLCLNTWEHVWLRDYGIGSSDGYGGKSAFAESWWNVIDWNVVGEKYAYSSRPMKKG